MFTFAQIKKFFQLNGREQARLVEAILYLAVARLVLILIPFNRLAPHLGVSQTETSETATNPDQLIQAAHTGLAVKIMSRLVPWDSMCLAQALAAKWMLERKGIANTLYLGVARDEQNQMLAHAWLRCGNLIVTGAPQHQKFTVVASFARK